jgi:hypothetical protein
MEFHPRLHPFSGHELAELVAISPDDDAMQQVGPQTACNCCVSMLPSARLGSIQQGQLHVVIRYVQKQHGNTEQYRV